VLGLNVTVTVAAAGTRYVDPGATATDNVDGVVTSHIIAQVTIIQQPVPCCAHVSLQDMGGHVTHQCPGG
jgi:hypothetical protein